MLVPLLRPAFLALCTAASFLALGRAPGAVTLRTRDLETSIEARRMEFRQDLAVRSPWRRR